MKKYILKSMIVSMLCILAASCVKDDELAEYGQQESSEKVFLQFTISLNEQTASSRTTWENYNPDNTSSSNNANFLLAENYINPVKVQALLYDLEGNFISSMKDVTVNYLENNTVTPENENPQKYALTGSFEAKSDEINKLSFKMMVFANCPTITKPEDYYNLTYDYNGWSLEKGIPMWGMATFLNVKLIENTSFSSPLKLEDPIYMLRSMAKIEVALNTEDGTAANYNLTSAELNKVMKTGMAVPAFKNEADETLSTSALEATTALSIEGVFNPASDNTTTGTLTGQNDVVYLYVPEYKNDGNDLTVTLNLTNKNNIDVYKDGEKNRYYFTHGTYQNGVPTENSKMNVVRNHYYKYTVSIKDGRRLVLKLQVKPWDKVEEVWNFEETLAVKISEQIVWENYRSIAESDNVVVVKNEGKVDELTYCKFTITSPQDATWQAVLSPEHGDPTAFEFVSAAGESIGISTTGNVKDGEVKLRIKPTGAVYAPNYHTARLLIYVNYMGRTQLAANLMPNGKQYYIIRQNPQ